MPNPPESPPDNPFTPPASPRPEITPTLVEAHTPLSEVTADDMQWYNLMCYGLSQRWKTIDFQDTDELCKLIAMTSNTLERRRRAMLLPDRHPGSNGKKPRDGDGEEPLDAL